MIFRPARLISVDPGSNYAGVSCSEFNDSYTQMTVVDSMTLDLDRLRRSIRYRGRFEELDETDQKIAILGDALFRYCVAWGPFAVVSESPYFRRFPRPFEILVKCVNEMGHVIREYDPNIPFSTLTPSEVKNAVNVKGGSNDKELIRDGIKRQKDLIVLSDLSSLSEHACDSIAVGYGYYLKHLKRSERVQNEYKEHRYAARRYQHW